MKGRVIVGILCILLSFSLSLAGYSYTRENCRQLEAGCVSALTAESPQAMLAKSRSLLSLWDSRRDLFGALLKHSDADELTRGFLLLENAVKAGDSDAADQILREMQALIRVVFYGERPDFENIF